MYRLTILLTLLSTAPAFAQKSVAETPYFPVPEGANWTYRLADVKVTVKVTKHEKIGDALTARLETLDKSEVVAVQNVTITDKAVARLAHNGEKLVPPLVLLQLPAAKGQSWDVDSTMTSRTSTDTIRGHFTTDEDDVKVPAGEFKKALRVASELVVNGQRVVIVSWYAEKVGLIKQRVRAGEQEHDMELEKVEFPK